VQFVFEITEQVESKDSRVNQVIGMVE
jgi:hypothetical protein